MDVPTKPGIGVEVKMEMLGKVTVRKAIYKIRPDVLKTYIHSS
jgi:hypothetical protein